ncbi:DUF1987 domain-containing protein [Reichenbachiella sp. MSK19-1]|uniref:DUF1987 domain-containing protein n=1 Tax=Reichenbachiella sp. MSK19-1 TaxID=1897631 RepID=UPI000E6C9B6B|nr:DUF1987 domain-containing protein [Reichenbachiella sp. MSK19-1]RJE74174.1 hypothetical protein BGP76_13360 [Reichenbachiella sp. MSK19-1]
MNKIIYRPTRTTPLIFFDPARGLLELRGKSSPENAIGFYTELINGIMEFADGGTKNLVANFKLEYFNTSSSKCIFDILKKILLVEQNGNKVSINWYYETYDEDMQEAGEDYADLLGATFNYIEIEL